MKSYDELKAEMEAIQQQMAEAKFIDVSYSLQIAIQVALNLNILEDGFQTQELTCSVFSYTLAQFKKLEIAEALQIWKEDLNDNSCSYPMLAQSPFNEHGLNLSTSIDEEPESEIVYVVPHYFYGTGDYEIEESIDCTYKIMLAPIVGALFEDRPINSLERDGDEIYFLLAGASDGTEFAVNFYWGNKLIGSCALADVDDDTLGDVEKKCI